MKKIFMVLTTMAFALTLAAAAPAQVVKMPHQARLQKTPAASEEAAPPDTKEKLKPEEKSSAALKPGHRTKHKPEAPKGALKEANRGKAKKRAGAHMITPQEIK